jgi:hypothetical protein
VIEQYGGVVGAHPGITARILGVNTIEAKAQLIVDGTIKPIDFLKAQDQGIESYKVVSLFIRQSHKRYEPLLTELQNRFSQGEDLYPKTLEAAYNRLVSYLRRPWYKWTGTRQTRRHKRRRRSVELRTTSQCTRGQ